MNIFEPYHNFIKQVQTGDKKSVELYLYYISKYSETERDTLANFIKTYESNNFDITKILDSKDFKENKALITNFLRFVDELPKEKSCMDKIGNFCKKYLIHPIVFLLTLPFTVIFERVKVPPQKKYRKKLTNIEDYLDYRYFEQQQFFSQSASKAKARFFNNQMAITLLSVLIPIVVLVIPWLSKLLWNKECDHLTDIITAIFSAVIAVLSSKEKLYKNLEDWTRNRDISEQLKFEYSLYQGKCDKYNIEDDSDGKKADAKFRYEVETIIQQAKDRFVKLRSSSDADEKGKGTSGGTNSSTNQN